MTYRNRNNFKNTFRYKQISTSNNEIIKVIHSTYIIKYWNYSERVNGIEYHYYPYDYSPRLFFKILWNFQIWYKRPKAKKLIKSKITSTISNLSAKAAGMLISAFVLPILSFIVWDKYKYDLIELWDKLFKQ